MFPEASNQAVADALSPLESYRISPLTGFVPETDPLSRLPDSAGAWDAVVADLRALIRSRQLRQTVVSLPPFDVTQCVDEPTSERALLILTVLANAWVWGDEQAAISIPRQISIPLQELATRMERPPLVHYASITLHNWRRIDPSGPIATDNLSSLVTFLGSVDEDWFLVSSIGVELAGAPLLRELHAAVNWSHTADDAELVTKIEKLAARMADVTVALGRVYQWCDPVVFFRRVRPYLTGWSGPGVIYEGVSDLPRCYVGGSAGQSSLIQALDAGMHVQHSSFAARTYLTKLRDYMPPRHRQFIIDIESVSRIAHRSRGGTPALKRAYNAVIHELDEFRLQHLGISRDYIETPAGTARDTVGTGGTPVGEFLVSLRNSTNRMQLD
jgi:indoleamine 2,3-dioxygenase